MSGSEHLYDQPQADMLLDAYLGEQLVATTFLLADRVYWEYSDDWRAHGFAVAPRLPLDRPVKPLDAERFLRNLLLEGPAFEELINQVGCGRGNTLGLLRELAADVASGIVLRPHGVALDAGCQFRELKAPELSLRLASAKNARELLAWDGKPRLSVAGVQAKLNLVKLSDGRLGFGEGTLCSTHIYKFELKSGTPHIVLNEWLTMQLAQRVGLSVADTKILTVFGVPTLEVTRFDRKLESDQLVRRRLVIDGCQAVSKPPEYKYERQFGDHPDVCHIRDGVNLTELFALTALCTTPVQARQTMLDWVLFNLLVGNADAHGKNISFFVSRRGLEITPLYDLVNIAVYPEHNQHLSMSIGEDMFDSSGVNAYHLVDMADEVGIPVKLVEKRLGVLLERIHNVMANHSWQDTANPAEQNFLQHYRSVVATRCAHFERELAEMPSIEL